MKIETKKVGLILSLSIFTSILALTLVSAASGATWANNFIQQVGNLFGTNSISEFLAVLISPQILFGLLVFLVIFAIISQISLFGEPWIKTTISIVIGLLAGGFIDASFIGPLLNQYTALGLTITLILPFLLLFYFLKEVAPQNRFVQHTVWTIYFIFVTTNAIANWNSLNNNLTKGLYWILIAASFFMIFFCHWIIEKLWKNELEEQIGERTNEAEAALTAQIAYDTERLPQLTGIGKTMLEKRIARQKEALKKMKGG